jgi:hypothetical protein
MTISHLAHDNLSIRCRTCGTRFEAPRKVLCNPEALVGMKESIAARHTCKSSVVLIQPKASIDDGLDRYWKGAMRRLLPA